jgi:putative pyruvate formate lyase activating enzyme
VNRISAGDVPSAHELSRDTYINLMQQYYPAYRAGRHPELARRPRRDEVEQARAWAAELGLNRVH